MDWLLRQSGETQRVTVGVRFIKWSLARNPKLSDATLARKPATVMLSYTDPEAFAGRIHQTNTSCSSAKCRRSSSHATP